MATLIHNGSQMIQVLMWYDDAPPDSPLEFHDEFSACNFLSGIISDPINRAILRAIFADISPVGNISGLTDHEIIQQLAWRVARGYIKFVPRVSKRISVGGVPQDDDESEEASPNQAEEKTWIEIQLVDEADQPVVRERFQISNSSGAVVAQGYTDAQGLADATNLDPGTYQVTFPNLDGDAWEKI